MIRELVMHPRLAGEDPVRVALAGCGGSGSQMLSGLARLHVAIRALGHPGIEVTAYDPDEVSQANVGRQLFAAADVGASKAVVLVTRANAWHGLAWRAETRAYTDAGGWRPHIVVSCVDTARARVAIGAAASRHRALLWLDLGNRAADGQVVLGIPPWNAEHAAYPYRLPTVLDLYPELARKFKEDAQAPSCSLAQALERQHLFVNQAVVTPALQLLWQVFRFGRTAWCGAFVNLETGRTTPLPVDPEAWKRFGHAPVDKPLKGFP